MGLPRSPSVAPQGTPFPDIYAAAVASSPELRQLGFTTQYGSLGSRLDAILGVDPNGEGRIDRLVDLTVGMDPATGKGMERPPSIFYVDGYWRTDGSASGFAYNGRGTIVASKSVILSDSLLYLGNMSNVNADAPKAGCAERDRSRALRRGGHARDHRPGEHLDRRSERADPRGGRRDARRARHQSRAVRRLRRHLLRGVEQSADVQRHRAGAPRHGTGSGLGRPDPGHQDVDCTAAQPPCRPVTFVRADTSCGGTEGCWRFLSKDPATGLFAVDTALSGFQECVTTRASPLTPPSCRRVTHFPLTINYDTRLQEHPELIPPGLPTGGRTGYSGLAARLWKDCGSNPACP